MKHSLLMTLAFGLILVSCQRSNPQQEKVRDDLNRRMALINCENLFDVLEQKMPRKQREAMEFLYAYMPLSDLTDYSGEYYLENVNTTLKARSEMPWGDSIPEREFRHFVLPVRVNNENMDNSRMVFYEELKDRVKNLSEYDAVLEVNHWCHEKVEYRPSDSRTSAPLATVKTAYGRCGEESTFLVAALRSVCIPARQVYTPRWAHCDDNHAWVEAYVGGKWYFLGACEPEPVLNLGWFNAPASRVLMVHTRAFGRYDGPEDVLSVSPNFTEINVTENYAATGRADIQVRNSNGRLVPDAKVYFMIYNYAEYYPFASKKTDSTGCVSLTAGLGDMLVWATDGRYFDFAELNFSERKNIDLTLVLNKDKSFKHQMELNIVPPKEHAFFPEVTAEMRAENDRRMKQEDSIRNAYVATFAQGAKGVCRPDLGDDCAEIDKLMKASRGNYQTLKDFLALEDNSNTLDRPYPIKLLQTITDKDLRDVSLEVLVDHVENSYMGGWFSNFNYTWNPRVAHEMLTPYKAFFQEVFKEYEPNFVNDPMLLARWCNDSLRIMNEQNSVRVPISPVGVYKSRVTDEFSRDIFYVAVARSLGIASRIDPVTRKVQYINKSNNWVDVDFAKAQLNVNPTGVLAASYKPIVGVDDPEYYKHFTISKYENGRYVMMPFDVGDPGFEMGDKWSHLLKNGLTLDAGSYLLTTGVRAADGSVASTLTFFEVSSDDTTQLDLRLIGPKKQLDIVGNINGDAMFIDMNDGKLKTLDDSFRGAPAVLAVLATGTEPTNHTMRDMADMAQKFEEWGGQMLFVFPDEDNYVAFDKNVFGHLPYNIRYGIDANGEISKTLVDSLQLNEVQLPFFIFLSEANHVVFKSQGYTIGLGDQLFKTIELL